MVVGGASFSLCVGELGVDGKINRGIVNSRDLRTCGFKAALTAAVGAVFTGIEVFSTFAKESIFDEVLIAAFSNAVDIVFQYIEPYFERFVDWVTGGGEEGDEALAAARS